MITSYTQSKFEIHQPLQEMGVSIQELVAKHMNEEERMEKLSFEGEQESLPSILEVIREEEDLSYNEDITSSNDGELEKLQRVENDAQEWKTLVAKEDEPTSPESYDMTKYEVLKTIAEMTPWGEMHEEFKIARVTPMSKLEECIVQLSKEMEATIVNKKKKLKIKK